MFNPCPFCDSKAIILYSEEIPVIYCDDPAALILYRVCCEDCGTQGSAAYEHTDSETALTKKTAISLWNKRFNYAHTPKTGLKPCPFCGHEQPDIHYYNLCDNFERIDESQINDIVCAEPECRAIGPTIGKGSIIDLWNTRTK